MGLTLESFRNLVGNGVPDGRVLSVSDNALKSDSTEEVTLSLLNAGDDKGSLAPMKNVYIRQQLLNDIRDSLKGVQSGKCQAFLRQAEVTLFNNDKVYDADKAQDDLDAKTVKDLLDGMDALKREFPKLIGCPGDSDEYFSGLSDSELKVAKYWLSLLDKGSCGNNQHFLSRLSCVQGAFASMLPDLLNQVDADLTSVKDTLPVIWDHLELGEFPANKTQEDVKKEFFKAFASKVVGDMVAALTRNVPNGALKDKLTENLKTFYLPPNSKARNEALDALKEILPPNLASDAFLYNLIQGFGEFNGLDYASKLKCLNNPVFQPSDENFMLKMSPTLGANCDLRARGEGDAPKLMRALHTELNFLGERQKGVRYAVNGNVIFDEFEKGELNQYAHFQLPLEVMGFSKEQILLSARYLNHTGMNLMASAGMSAIQENAVVDISKDGDDMKVRVRMPSRRYAGFKPDENDPAKLTFGTVHDEKAFLVHEFVISRDGKGMTQSIGYRRADELPEQGPQGAVLIPSRAQARKLLHPGLEIMDKATGKATGVADFENLQPAADGETILCDIRLPNGHSNRMAILRDGTLITRADFEKGVRPEAKTRPQGKDGGPGFSDGQLRPEDEGTLKELARMAYGSGRFEKKSGGEGYVGIVPTATGGLSVVKFATKPLEHFAHTPTTDELRSSNELRNRILSIARHAKFSAEELNELKQTLRVPPSADYATAANCPTLLLRTDAAKVIAKFEQKIGQEDVIWDAATDDVDMDNYRTVGSSDFETVRAIAEVGSPFATSRLLGTCGVTMFQLGEAIDTVADKYRLTFQERNALTRTTMAYLAALAEEADPLPAKGPDLLRQISTGNFKGTHLGLLHLGKKVPSAGGPQPSAAESSLMGLLDDDDAEAAAYFLGKFSNPPDVFVLKALVENRRKLLDFRAAQGYLTLDDLFEQHLAQENDDSLSLPDQQNRFYDGVKRKLLHDFETSHPECGIQDVARLVPAAADNPNSYGLPLEDLLLVRNHRSDPGKLRVSPRVRAYDKNDLQFSHGTKASLVDEKLAGDFLRCKGNGKITIVLPGDNREFAAEIKAGENELVCKTHANDVYENFKALLGYGPDKPLPEPPAEGSEQIRGLLLAAGQAGNSVLSLCEIPELVGRWPTQKTFSPLPGGAVRYTVAAEHEGRRYAVSFDIGKNGDSTFRGIETFDLENPDLTAAQREVLNDLGARLKAIGLEVGPDVRGEFVKVAADGKSIRYKVTGLTGARPTDEILITPYGEVVTASEYEESLANLDPDKLTLFCSYDQRDLLRSFDPFTLVQLNSLVSRIMAEDPKPEDRGHRRTVLISCLTNMMPRAMENVRSHGGNGMDRQENFNKLWAGLGLEGAAPELKGWKANEKKLSQALIKRISDDIYNAIKSWYPDDGKLRSDIQKYLFPANSGEKITVDRERKKPGGPNFNTCMTKSITILQGGCGLPYGKLLECVRDPTFVPKTSDFYWKPTDSSLPVKKIKRTEIRASNPDEESYDYLDGVYDSLGLYMPSANRRYANFKFSLDGEDIDFGLKDGTKESCARNFERKLKAEGHAYSDAQIVRAVSYLNDDYFSFSPNEYVVKSSENCHVSVSRFPEDGGFLPSDMRLLIELPIEGGTLVHEVAVHEDGSYRMVSHEKG